MANTVIHKDVIIDLDKAGGEEEVTPYVDPNYDLYEQFVRPRTTLLLRFFEDSMVENQVPYALRESVLKTLNDKIRLSPFFKG